MDDQIEAPGESEFTAPDDGTSGRSSALEDLAAQLYIGRYVVLRALGSGAMGVVYRAHDEVLDRKIALKLLRRSTRDGSDGRARLLREAQALARLSHPNVVQVYEAGVHGDQVYLAMELLHGDNLRSWADEGPRSWRAVLAAYIQAARGLAAAHAVGLVHREHKPYPRDPASTPGAPPISKDPAGLQGSGFAPHRPPLSPVAPLRGNTVATAWLASSGRGVGRGSSLATCNAASVTTSACISGASARRRCCTAIRRRGGAASRSACATRPARSTDLGGQLDRGALGQVDVGDALDLGGQPGASRATTSKPRTLQNPRSGLGGRPQDRGAPTGARRTKLYVR